MSSLKYDDQYNLRLYKTDSDRFLKLRKKLNLNPRDCLVALMDYYEAEHAEETEAQEFSLVMQIRAHGGKHTKLHKYTFKGTAKYTVSAPYCHILDSQEAYELEKDFGLKIDPEDVQYYFFSSKLDVYWHFSENCYVVQEVLNLWVNRDEVALETIWSGRMPENPLSVQRCNFVKDYDELCAKFGKYANGYDMQELARIMATDIGNNYRLMDELFWG